MAKTKLNLSLNNLLTCVLYAIIGVLLITMKAGSLGILMTIVGALFILMGIVDILKAKDVTKGIVELVIGLAIIICGWLIATIVLLIFGILLIIKGAIDILKNVKNGLTALLAPIVTLVIGILLVCTNFFFAIIDILCIIAGIIFIINAVLTLFGKSLKK